MNIHSFILATTCHDPRGVLIPLIERDGPRLADFYSNTLVALSPSSHRSLRPLLEDLGIRLAPRDEDNRARAYLSVLQSARLLVARDDTFIHYCDFDRWLHWIRYFPAELPTALTLAATLLSTGAAGMALYYRTPRAFATHPPCQRQTEGIGNRLAAMTLHRPGVDLFSGSFLIRPDAVDLLTQLSQSVDESFYAEWPRIMAEGLGLDGLSVEGLEWETPDQHGDAITALGYDGWVRQFESPEQWAFRVGMLERWVEVLLR